MRHFRICAVGKRQFSILEPQRYLDDVVSILFFILNNNTHATGVHIPKTIFVEKHSFSIRT
jgi:hypothetical protein